MESNRFIRRHLLRGLAFVVASITTLVVVAPAAQAYDNGQFEFLYDNGARSGQCLDSNFAGDVYTNPCNWDNQYQRWLVTKTNTTSAIDGHQQYRLKNAATNLYLTQYRVNGPVVFTAPFGSFSSDYQKIDGVGSSWANVTLRSSHSNATNMAPPICVTRYSNAQVYSADCGQPNQHWVLNK
ncbi:hypothetical protein SAMN05192558_10438 [Actinokineospora alba]|uniref:Uncharacterized protein n=2 Tax=Actinokineospora alba TaxID=504798 RepID=A0A1H0L7Y7_9PSEU|nr:hypothetical protein C8E96_2758 [Actinokineospora alba]SDJ03717.1 hypothetical protein SAMN05421871_109260 [Actinokineospora alba]SDO64060.1 hypothetical protein SAMN05192558_10438 [Actinokineospora alba]